MSDSRSQSSMFQDPPLSSFTLTVSHVVWSTRGLVIKTWDFARAEGLARSCFCFDLERCFVDPSPFASIEAHRKPSPFLPAGETSELPSPTSFQLCLCLVPSACSFWIKSRGFANEGVDMMIE